MGVARAWQGVQEEKDGGGDRMDEDSDSSFSGDDSDDSEGHKVGPLTQLSYFPFAAISTCKAHPASLSPSTIQEC
jgi:hypothetical protein